ncbi:hypothetical protein DRW07_08650 [Alteromonas sediminis]|uniref:SxtJ n=1 Tax=Alteromonas sediminis TaxID=2259342 RepID=A0A3N5Y369_9ALTE|nr:hypothetical protein [Alteromonas sediminis]RPJ67573.1 hypothetical protein DRW07_08650 [Alteromonas sediminis]
MAGDLWLPTADASDTKAMRDFSRGFSLLLCLFFLGIIPWLFDTAIPYWPIVASAVLLIGGQFFPLSIYPVYRLWMVIASLLAWVNTRFIMLIAFYVLIFPIGIALQLMNKLQYKHVKWPISEGQHSYWVKREQSPNEKNLKEPF